MTVSSIHTHLEVKKKKSLWKKGGGQPDLKTVGHGCILKELAQGAYIMKSPFKYAKIKFMLMLLSSKITYSLL